MVQQSRERHIYAITLSDKLPETESIHPNETARSNRNSKPKNPGPPRRNLKRERDTIVISDDDENEARKVSAGEPNTLDLWDDLVKDRPDQWDIRDALMHGKTRSSDDPSINKPHMQRDESLKKVKGTCEQSEEGRSDQ